MARELRVISNNQKVRQPKPEWLRIRLGDPTNQNQVLQLIEGLNLHTVCQEARCPNIFECWSDRTATFMLGGDICTRHCGFCAVGKGQPGSLDPEEPRHVAEAVNHLNLAHAVITSVNRDDLPDGGAAHWAETIRQVRAMNPECKIEVLIPDFNGDEAALNTVLDAQPDVLNHNTETIARLYRRVRPDAVYQQSLTLLQRAAAQTRPRSPRHVDQERNHGRSRRDVRRSRRSHARPALGLLRHHDDWPVSTTARAAFTGRALRHAARVCEVARDWYVTRISSRRIEPAHAFLVPRARTSREMKATDLQTARWTGSARVHRCA